MRTAILALASVAALCSQTPRTTVNFYAQPQRVGTLRQYVVGICNTGDVRMDVYAAQVWSAAREFGISAATHANVIAEAGREDRLSWQRKALLGLEVAGAVVSVLEAGDVIQIKEPSIKAAIPAVTATIRIGTTLVKREQREFEFPPNMLPGLFQIHPGQCVEYTLFGSERSTP